MIIRSIDVETTGFPPSAAVIEFGWSDIRIEDGKLVEISEPKAMLVNPWRGNPDLVMTPGAQAVHLIDKEDLINAPAVDIGMRAIAGADVYLAHNSSFEESFIKPNCPWICTLKLSRRLYPTQANHKLQDLRFSLPVAGIDREIARLAHRAGPDAYVAAYLFRHMLLDGLSVAEAIEWSGGAMPMPTCPIGKHKGKPWSEVPGDYLVWLAFKSDMGADIKRAARTELNTRKMPKAPKLSPKAAPDDDGLPF